MAHKRHTPEEVINLLRQVELETGRGLTTARACKHLGVAGQPCYRWHKEYEGLKLSQERRLKDLV